MDFNDILLEALSIGWTAAAEKPMQGASLVLFEHEILVPGFHLEYLPCVCSSPFSSFALLIR